MNHSGRLLQLLEPPVRPVGAPPRVTVARPPIEQQDFDQLLEEARHAQPIQLSPAAADRLDEMGQTLSTEQMQLIAAAAERAAGRGAAEALMMVDGLHLRVNLPERTVSELLDPREAGGIVTGIDSAVFIDKDDSEQPQT